MWQVTQYVNSVCDVVNKVGICVQYVICVCNVMNKAGICSGCVQYVMCICDVLNKVGICGRCIQYVTCVCDVMNKTGKNVVDVYSATSVSLPVYVADMYSTPFVSVTL